MELSVSVCVCVSDSVSMFVIEFTHTLLKIVQVWVCVVFVWVFQVLWCFSLHQSDVRTKYGDKQQTTTTTTTTTQTKSPAVVLLTQDSQHRRLQRCLYLWLLHGGSLCLASWRRTPQETPPSAAWTQYGPSNCSEQTDECTKTEKWKHEVKL